MHDSDGTAELNGGNVTVNGETITEITNHKWGGRESVTSYEWNMDLSQHR